MAEIKGSAKGTLKGQDTRPTEMEQLAMEGAETARKLLSMFTTPPTSADVDVEGALAPLEGAIKAMPDPAAVPLPSAPEGTTLGLGLLATNLAAVAARNPLLAQAGLETARSRIEGREAVQRGNTLQQNQADAGRQAGLLALRERILTEKLSQELAEKKSAQADKTAKELFVVQTALSHVSDRLKAEETATLSEAELRNRAAIANQQATLAFVASVMGIDDDPAKSGGMDQKGETEEITKLNDFVTSIDLKIGPEGKWSFSKKVPGDEEMAAHVRVINSYLSSPSQRVRAAALFNLNNMLQSKFGNDQRKKEQFLITNGLVSAPAQ